MILFPLIFNMICLYLIIHINAFGLPRCMMGPLFPEDWEWTKFIWKHRRLAQRLDNESFILKVRNKTYIIIFLESWMFAIYEGKTREEIGNKYDLGGQSNRADYLTTAQKKLGTKIEKYYYNLKEIT